MVLARWSDGALPPEFYRAAVIEEKKGGVLVRFVDYGNHDVVSMDDIRPMPQELATFPMQVCMVDRCDLWKSFV